MLASCYVVGYKELIANGARKFLLNLADLTQIDSSGVNIIVKTYHSLRGHSSSIASDAVVPLRAPFRNTGSRRSLAPVSHP